MNTILVGISSVHSREESRHPCDTIRSGEVCHLTAFLLGEARVIIQVSSGLSGDDPLPACRTPWLAGGTAKKSPHTSCPFESIWGLFFTLRPRAVLVGTFHLFLRPNSSPFSRQDEKKIDRVTMRGPLKTKQRTPTPSAVPAPAVTVDDFNVATRHMDE